MCFELSIFLLLPAVLHLREHSRNARVALLGVVTENFKICILVFKRLIPLRCMGTPPSFSTMFSKGDNFRD